MDITVAELYLGAWAILATLIAAYYHGLIKRHEAAGYMLTKMLTQVVLGTVVPTKNLDGTFTIENDDARIRVKEVSDEY